MLGTNKVVLLLLLPYKSLTDSKLRELELQLEDAMRSTGMTVVDKSDCKQSSKVIITIFELPLLVIEYKVTILNNILEHSPKENTCMPTDWLKIKFL